MILAKITTDTLHVQKEAIIGQATITTSLSVNNDIRCLQSIYCDTILGYRKPGDLMIENIVISDHDTMKLRTVNTQNLNIISGSLVLKGNSTIMTESNDILVDTNGNIHGSAILHKSILSDVLGDESVISEKIATNSVLSSHLSSGLTFRGTCKFDNIDLNGNLNTLSNVITICGVTCSNSTVGVGGVTQPKYPLHVMGTALIEENNYRSVNGLSNNIGIFSMKSSHIETPLLIKMSYNDLCTSSFKLATYTSSFGISGVEQGDLIISTADSLGGPSKIFINESMFISSSNVGIWKQNPLAPLHTTVFASDKVGIGGVTNPTETLDMIGNVTIMRDVNATSCFLKITDIDERGTIMQMTPERDFAINNETGDITVNAFDNDPSKCSHIKIQKVSGHIGLGTTSPTAPLHIHGFLRPGAINPSQTVLIEALNPSIKLKSPDSTCMTSINSGGQYVFEQISNLIPYIKILSTNRTFSVNCDLIIGASDDVIEIGPRTKFVMFSDKGQQGVNETLINESVYAMNVTITGPTRVLNWATEINSIAISSTSTIVNKIVSDVLYRNPYGENVFYIENALKLIGIGTANPRAAIDIYSSFTSNVINYDGKCIFDTGYNLKNIISLSIKGPFSINGFEMFDNENNLLSIKNIHFRASLIHQGTYVLIDNERNMMNINSATIRGPFYVGGKEIIDLNDNLLNLNNIHLSNSIISKDRVFLDRDLNVSCGNFVASGDVFAFGKITSEMFIGIENAGFMNNHNNVMNVAPLTKACFVDALYNDILVVDIVNNIVEINGYFKHDGQTLIDPFRNMSNINAASIYGPFVVNNRTILTPEYGLNVMDMNIDNSMTHGGVVVLDSDKNLLNISNISCTPPIYANNLLFLDEDMNLKNVENTQTRSLTIQDVRFKCLDPNQLSVECEYLGINIKGYSLMECSENSIKMHSECIINSIHTDLIRSDASIQFVTSATGFVATNVGYKSPLYVFGNSSFKMHVNETNATSPVLSIVGPTKTLCEISTPYTILMNNVIIGTPKETTHKLSVGGTIYADDDIFSFSDKRDKSNIRKIGGALRKLNQIRGVLYDRRGRKCTGVLAQDVLKVLPEAVYKDDTTGHLSVAYGNMIGLLIESVKEMDFRNRRNRLSRVRMRVGRRQKYIGSDQ